MEKVKMQQANPSNRFQFEMEFTEVYAKYRLAPIATREVECLKAQYPAILKPIQENDLFAGRMEYPLVGFSPHNPGGLAYYCDFQKLEALLRDETLSDVERQTLNRLKVFWKNETTRSIVRQAYPADMAEVFPTDNYQNEKGIGFPLYRMGGASMNYAKLLRLGLPGLRKEIEFHARQKGNVGQELYEGMHQALNLLEDVCRHYVEQAISMANVVQDSKRKRQLVEMAAVLDAITKRKPDSLQEAIQLFWIYSLVTDVRNYGRMDVYLGDIYVNDLEQGKLTEEKAFAYVKSIWHLIADRHTIFESRIVLGGTGRPNPDNADRFAMLAMEASRVVLEIEPQLSLRCYQGMNPLLLDKALEVLGEGRTFPILYNDDVNVTAVQNAFQVSLPEAEQYIPFGCGEYLLDHCSFSTPSGVINLLKALEAALHNGNEVLERKRIGVQTGPVSEFHTFEDLFTAYKRQVEHQVKYLALQEALEYKVAGETAPFLFLSMLYNDCIARGKAIFSGGIRYLGGTLESYGNTNTADSLTAIHEHVYKSQVVSLGELVEALDSNFKNHDILRKKLLRAPKFGNDDETADVMMQRVHDHVCLTARNQNRSTGLAYYLIVVINNLTNTILGHQTAASADGRRSGEPVANGNTPSGGSDRNGLTALLNSLAKPDPSIHAGAVHNLKFSKEWFSTSRRKIVLDLLLTYFHKGGTQAMITVINREDLENAMIEPEKYAHVFVRVGGFSARFVELPEAVQREIISRTVY